MRKPAAYHLTFQAPADLRRFLGMLTDAVGLRLSSGAIQPVNASRFAQLLSLFDNVQKTIA